MKSLGVGLIGCLVLFFLIQARVIQARVEQGGWSIASIVPRCSITGQYVCPTGSMTALQVNGLSSQGAEYNFFASSGANYPIRLPVGSNYSDDLQLSGREAVKLAWTGPPPQGNDYPPAVIAVRPYAWYGLQFNQNDQAPAVLTGTVSGGYNDSEEQFQSAPNQGAIPQDLIMGSMEYYEPSPSGNINLTTAQNGPFILPYPPGRSVYLIPLQGSSGTANYTTPTLRVHGQATKGNAKSNQTEFLLCGLRCGIKLDNRWLSPVSPITTYFTGTYPHVQVLTHKASVNVLDADVGDPEDVQDLPISVVAEGNWSPNTPYKWYDGATGNYGSGVISNGVISFNDFVAPALPGTTDHIYVAAYDAVDHAKASADIYVTFHPMYDNWIELHTVKYPLPLVDAGKYGTAHYKKTLLKNLQGGWNFLCYCTQSGASGFLQRTWYVETDTGSISGSTHVADANLAFRQNEHFTVGGSVKCKLSHKLSSAPYPAAAFYIAVSSTYRSGVCAVWGPDGFTGFVGHQSTTYSPDLKWAVDPTNP